MGTGGLFCTLKEVCNLFGKREAARWAQGGAWKPGAGLCAGRQDGREEPSGVGRTEKMWLWWGWGHREPGHIGSGRALNKQITQGLHVNHIHESLQCAEEAVALCGAGPGGPGALRDGSGQTPARGRLITQGRYRLWGRRRRPR